MFFKLSAAVDSIWVTRTAKGNVNAAIALRKVIGMGYKLVGGISWSWIVQSVGISGLYATCAAVYVPVIACLALLAEPAPVIF